MFSGPSANHTPSGVVCNTVQGIPQVERKWCNRRMKPIDSIRRERLAEIVSREGLAVASKRFGKPDRQINDMLARRKSFGEKVARAMEKSYSPTADPGWLDRPSEEEPSNPPGETGVPEYAELTIGQMMEALVCKLLHEAHPADIEAAPSDLKRLIEKARDPGARVRMSPAREHMPDRRRANDGRQR